MGKNEKGNKGTILLQSKEGKKVKEYFESIIHIYGDMDSKRGRECRHDGVNGKECQVL